LGNIDGDPDPGAVYKLWKKLWMLAVDLKTRYGRTHIFYRTIFLELVAAATDLACEDGFIAP
jgi:hypothetical protein